MKDEGIKRQDLQTKQDLLELAEINFNKLLDFIEELPDEIKTKTYNNNELNNRDKTASDVMCHLYEWHQLLLNWINANRKGKAKPFLPEPYNWKTYPAMNVAFWKKHQNTPLVDAEKMFKKSFTWTGTLGSYCVSATASHYDTDGQRSRRMVIRPTIHIVV
ncbi:MAG: ClbS/DfsB family four-helix bundle protein [Spirochaetaceae bacterium]|jgi:hypothetical protein|nr:ClbS/DfsB family four-helix bundle protein [Spirochaetaceae bacterium]